MNYDKIAAVYDKMFSDEQSLKENRELFEIIKPKGRLWYERNGIQDARQWMV